MLPHAFMVLHKCTPFIFSYFLSHELGRSKSHAPQTDQGAGHETACSSRYDVQRNGVGAQNGGATRSVP